MSIRRRDNKNRVLREGESQRKDGIYVYKYVDKQGNTRFLYSSRLTEKDPRIPGKKKDLSLREKIKELEKLERFFPSHEAGKITVIELVDKYIEVKRGVRATTRVNYKTIRNIVEKEDFGKLTLDKVRTSDAKRWLIKMQAEGRGYSSIHSIRGVVRPAFQMAVDDDILVKNPFNFELATVVVNNSVTREAISRAQERNFLKFIKYDEHFSQYYDGMFILFNTGLRISEFVGLTVSDIDFKKKVIKVDHQLQRINGQGYVIQKTKTASGNRLVPMTRDVAECFKNIIMKRPTPKVEPMIDGYAGFLFLDKNYKPMVSLHWEKYFQHAVEKYNKIYKEELPTITPHVCRHTFCSKMARSGMNPKTLQTIMGHSDIGVTLNVYTHFDFEDTQKEMDEIYAKMEKIQNSESGTIIKFG